tara:strand:- start:603 stop:1064 length:462 start_codon:yes stop_codon:yes gene_type:complete
MYLPLTGYRDKDSFEERMSIESIGPSLNSQAVRAMDPSSSTQDNLSETNVEQKQNQNKSDELTQEQKDKAVEGFYAAGSSMNTQDFMVLRAQASDGQFEVLDRVIDKMKENMEAVGEAIEAVQDMVEKTSEDNIALQVLQKTLEAMDEVKDNG